MRLLSTLADAAAFFIAFVVWGFWAGLFVLAFGLLQWIIGFEEGA